ncbi:hypothetical protein TIFTF001_017674 [Ficus carica]|uniref:Uncharacterized protein n=1 Tax=Ficus carica TaxID=3494 RepID=A0AA88AR32_FICCA|nr:hypothetical protein TIFTF001_017674 [Ficus carica]
MPPPSSLPPGAAAAASMSFSPPDHYFQQKKKKPPMPDLKTKITTVTSGWGGGCEPLRAGEGGRMSGSPSTASNTPTSRPPILHQQAIHPQIGQDGGGMSGSPSMGSSTSRHHPYPVPRDCRPHRDDGVLAATSSRRNRILRARRPFAQLVGGRLRGSRGGGSPSPAGLGRVVATGSSGSPSGGGGALGSWVTGGE